MNNITAIISTAVEIRDKSLRMASGSGARGRRMKFA
jgi:hypothetical protein